MGIISTIKSVLGLEEREREFEETSVTVEREPEAEPEAESERAVKEPEPIEESGPEEASSESEGEPVEEIKGIGPAYAGRLEQAGIESVADLAAADAADLAAETDISETRIEGWIERARAR